MKIRIKILRGVFMFQASEPIFHRHTVLKAKMLEDGISLPVDILRLIYSNYSNGILCGVQIHVEDNYLALLPGIILYNSHLYHLKEKVLIPYEANNTLMYLKISFLEPHVEGDYYLRSTDIYLTSNQDNRSTDMELCRFNLQKGAVLRNQYCDLKDYATEYNTVNILSVPYAAIGESSISPQITKRFAKEMLKKDLQKPLDAAFVMECMRGETIPRDMLIAYISRRIDLSERVEGRNMGRETQVSDLKLSNEDIHRYLVQILESVQDGERSQVSRRPYGKIIV